MDPPNVILIVLDTMRKDILPMYGGTANTPNLRKLAEDSVVFPNPVAPSPWTLPSHMSIFTGLYPREHGVHEDPEEGIDKNLNLQFNFKNKTIARFFKKNGYTNIGFSANGFISETSVFSDNFDYFQYQHSAYLNKKNLDLVHDFLPLKLEKLLYHPKSFIKLYEIYKINKFQGWPLRKAGNYILQNLLNSSFPIPFFLFINFMEMHDPYTNYEIHNSYYNDLLSIKKFPIKIIKKMKKNYLIEANIIDEYIGELIKHLKNINQYENSLIIVTSDHGQAFKEKNYIGHGLFLYDELIEIPLIIKYPKNKKFPVFSGYQSIVDLNFLIKNVVEGNIIDITKDKAFSEAWGFQNNLNKEMRMKDNGRFNVPRKAIYKNGFKLVINKKHEIEEFSYNKKFLDPKENKVVLNELMSEIEIFKGTENF